MASLVVFPRHNLQDLQVAHLPFRIIGQREQNRWVVVGEETGELDDFVWCLSVLEGGKGRPAPIRRGLTLVIFGMLLMSGVVFDQIVAIGSERGALRFEFLFLAVSGATFLDQEFIALWRLLLSFEVINVCLVNVVGDDLVG